jgi:WD40 repeat protein
VINDAHKLEVSKRLSSAATGVTAICVDNSNQRIVTGGADSQVRVWHATAVSQGMLASMKEHKGTVNAVAITASDAECISASDDGSCIVWDLHRFVRRNIIYAQTYFKSVSFLQDESQLVTVGSDRKVTYWDATDCSTIRELEGSKTGEINSIDISPDGTQFVTGGGDRMVKLWDYDEGVCQRLGIGHSGTITRAVFSPDGERVVSVGDEGAIMIWKRS